MALNIPVFNSKSEGCFLALGIGTESIKAVLFKKEKENICVFKNYYEYLDEFGDLGERNFGKTVAQRAISSITKKINELKFKPNSVMVELPANIIKARIASVDYQRGEPKRLINNKEETDILHTVFREIKKKSLEDSIQKTGILAEDFDFLFLEILEIIVEGYKVSKIQGFSGKDLRFKFLVTFIPRNYLRDIEKIFQDIKLKNVKFFHETQGLKYYVARENLTGVFINIGGMMTKIFLVDKGQLEMISDFEIGSRLFSTVLSENLGMSLERARLLKEGYSNRSLSEDVRKKINEFFLPSAKKWFSALKKELGKEKNLLPHNFYLFGGGSELPEFKELIENDDWRNFSFISQPEVKIIFPKDLKNVQYKEQNLVGPKDVSLLLLCYYVL